MTQDATNVERLRQLLADASKSDPAITKWLTDATEAMEYLLRSHERLAKAEALLRRAMGELGEDYRLTDEIAAFFEEQP